MPESQWLFNDLGKPAQALGLLWREIYSHDIDRFPGPHPACVFHLYDQLFTITEHSRGVVWSFSFRVEENAITQIIASHEILESSLSESFIWQTFTKHFLVARYGTGLERGGGGVTDRDTEREVKIWKTWCLEQKRLALEVCLCHFSDKQSDHPSGWMLGWEPHEV